MKYGVRVVVLLMVCVLFGSGMAVMAATIKEEAYRINAGDKLFDINQITKGLVLKRDGLAEYIREYQIVSFSNNKMKVRPGVDGCCFILNSKDKILTLKKSPKCKFYVTSVVLEGKCKQVSAKKALLYCKKTPATHVNPFGGEKVKDYWGGYCAELYTKNGKVVAVVTNFGV